MTTNSSNDALAEREARLGALFRAALMGDAVAYKAFLTDATTHVRAYLSRRLSRQSDIEDLLQEVLLAIHTKRHTYDANRPVTSWMFAIAQYKLIDHLRRHRHDRNTDSLDEDLLAEFDAEFFASRRDVEKLLATLPDRQRLPIVHVKLEGLSVAETAKLTGISESAVKVGIHRGLKALSRRIRGNS